MVLRFDHDEGCNRVIMMPSLISKFYSRNCTRNTRVHATGNTLLRYMQQATHFSGTGNRQHTSQVHATGNTPLKTGAVAFAKAALPSKTLLIKETLSVSKS